MKHSLHRLLAALLAALTLISLAPAPAMASEAAAGQELTADAPERANDVAAEAPGNPGESAEPIGETIQSPPLRLPGLRSIPIAGGLIVFTDAELRAALTNASVSTIYLGHHKATDATRTGATVNSGLIKMTQGVTIAGEKTIIGTDPENGRRVTLEDRTASFSSDTMQVPANTKVTLRSVNFTGHNMYGALCSNGANVSMNFVDVTYTGRQMAYNEGAGSETIIDGCNITLQTMDGNASQELVEGGKVIFRGNCAITKPSTGDSLIWLRNTGSGAGSIVVDQGADVTVNSAGSYLFYIDQNNSSITIAGKLSIDYGSSNGFAANSARITSMSVSGEMNVRYTTANGNSALALGGSLNVTGILRVERAAAGAGYAIDVGTGNAVTVGPGATLEASRTGGTTALVRASVLTINNPKRVVLHSAASTIASARLDIKTQALNYWTGTPDTADTMANMPARIWNNGDLSAFSLSVNGTTVSQSGLSDGGKGIAPDAVALNNTAFVLANARRLTMGDFSLSVDAPPISTNQLTGVAPAGAQVKGLHYTPAMGKVQETSVTTADGSGHFTATAPSNWGTQGHLVYALANSGQVKAYARNLILIPAKVTVKDQTYAYNGQPQGKLGTVTIAAGEANPPATVSSLQSGHRLAQVTISGAQKTHVSETSALKGSAPKIVDGSGADVTHQYSFTEADSFTDGTLRITPKGGTAPGGKFKITAADQTYTYNGQAQGNVGNDLAVGSYTTGSLVTSDALATGDSIKTISIGGSKATIAGTSDLTPSAAVIVNASGTDVTGDYAIDTATSYVKGRLIITPISGAGVKFTALDQDYVYNDQIQGNLGVITLTKGQANNYASFTGLLPGDWLEKATLTVGSGQSKIPGSYSIEPSAAVIRNAANADVTGSYTLTAANYVNGTLTIHKKGSGATDPSTGGEYPLVVRAANQTYIYDALPHGIVGTGLVLANYPSTPLATATQLISGHTIQSITIGGAQASTYSSTDLTPSAVVIVDSQGTNVTPYYNIDNATSYIKGKLLIVPTKVPLEISALDQSFIYDGLAHDVSTRVVLAKGVPNDYAEGVGLEGLDWLSELTLTLTGGPQTEAGDYVIVPSDPLIRNETGTDVSGSYQNLLLPGNFTNGTMTIHKKGNGVKDPVTGGEHPMSIKAVNQTYTYNGQPQGNVGGLTVGSYPAGSLITATALVSGHYVDTVTIGGSQRTNVGSDELTPSAPLIRNASGTDVTTNYYLDATSYIKGKLTIASAGAGVQITALNQSYIYNDQPQGTLNEITLIKGQANANASATGLQAGDWLEKVTLTVSGGKPTLPGTYSIEAGSAVIRNAAGADVTSSYTLSASNYVDGTLTIHKKGSGVTDSTGGETPLRIKAADQTYTYNGTPQGIVGSGLTLANYPAATLATATALINGHSIKTVTIDGAQATNAGTSDLTPTAVMIVNASGQDVTNNYLINTTSYIKGTLTIAPFGGPGGKLKMTATNQSYVYNGRPQGDVGNALTLANYAAGSIVTSDPLATGDSIKSVAIGGSQRTNVGSGVLTPSAVMIVNAKGADVTANYDIDATSYVKGQLTITPKGGPSGGKFTITAADQTYEYNGQPQGIVGNGLTVANYTADSIVTSDPLGTGDFIETIHIVGSQATNVGTSDLTPAGAVVRNAAGVDVTSNYDIDTNSSYINGKLTITKAGGAGIKMTALNQSYVYNGQPQGTLDTITLVHSQPNAYVTASGLQTGDWLAQVKLSVAGGKPTEPGAYSIVATGAVIRNASGQEVTASYSLTDANYLLGTLTIHKKGSGTADPAGGETPLQVKATDQTYTYNAQAQGKIGVQSVTAGQASPLVADVTGGLLPGHAISWVRLSDGSRTDVGASDISPQEIKIYNGSTEVTSYYRIDSTSYKTGGKVNVAALAIEVQAGDQTHVYNDQPGGAFGNGRTVSGGSPATASGLATGDLLSGIDLTAATADASRVNAGAYDREIIPSGAKIFNGGTNVTGNYSITYKPGKLTIEKKGDSLNNSLPLLVAAQDQSYPVTGSLQGVVGLGLKPADYAADFLVKAAGLVSGHAIKVVDIGGTQCVNVGDTSALTPANAKIVKNLGQPNETDVTANYNLDYVKGKLSIYAAGNTPIKIVAKDQAYVYNGQAQGVAASISVSNAAANPYVSATGLMGTDILTVTLSVRESAHTKPGAYHLDVSGATVKHADGSGATANYTIDPSASYVSGALTIYPKGNGTSDPNGGELPLVVTAKDQTYTYNGAPQGTVGTVSNPAATLATATALLAGHKLSAVYLGDATGQRTLAGTYDLAIAAAKIEDGSGNDVTDCYRIDTATVNNQTYMPAKLIIQQRGAVTVTALAQKRMYDGTPQGSFGTMDQTGATVWATATGLATGDALAYVTLTAKTADAQRVIPAIHTDEILPSMAKIYRGTGANAVDVTASYLNITYAPGNLTITKRGDGTDGNGDPLPIKITAKDQTYAYNGQLQGTLGALTAPSSALAAASALATGQTLASVTLDGTQKKDVDSAADPARTITPKLALIVKNYGLSTQEDVTGYYLIDNTSYIPGKLSITQGQSTLKITALDQTYTYDGTAQGVLGALSENGTTPQIVGGQSLYVKAEGLLGNDRLAGVTLAAAGGAKKNPGGVAITASAAIIVDANGNNVTGSYTFGSGTYVPGTLTIKQLPVTITAADQTYTYDGTSQGTVGVQANPGASLLQVSPGLAAGDRITSVNIGGSQLILPGTQALTLSAAQMYAGTENVTSCYDVTFAQGTLTVKKRGNTDGTPLTITAQAQSFVYDGTERGTFGQALSVTQPSPVATASNLATGHALAKVDIQRKDPSYVNAGVYTGAVIPAKAVITDGSGGDVTAGYDIDIARSYVAGTLTITKIGAPGTTPATITGKDQSFIYNDQPQGDVGAGRSSALVTVTGLAATDAVDTVTIGGRKETVPGVYQTGGKGTLLPAGAVIRNTAGVDVSGNYQDIAYVPGTLTIYPKGNGTTDPNGGERPLTVAAAQQTYVYNGQAQGKVGTGLTVDPADPLAAATGLLTGHKIQIVDILGSQITMVGNAPITPGNVKIVDGAGNNMTPYYRIDPVASYIASTLNIVGIANANVKITANDQLYVYNGQAQGALGRVDLTSVAGASAASVTGLISGHRLVEAVLSSAPAAPCVEPGSYGLSVTKAKIVDASGTDVTAGYSLTAQNFVDGILTIQKKGGGTDPSTGLEKPLIITALDQRYVYDGTAKGDFGTKSGATAIAAAATVKDALVPGDVLSSLTIAKKTPGDTIDAGSYPGELVPGALSVTRNGVDVTAKYYQIDAASYVPGNLIVEKKGNGVDPNTGEQLPLLIYGQNQLHEYDGQLHGTFGTALANGPQAPLAIAVGLVPGHTLSAITLSGKTGGQRTEPGDYVGELVSSAAIIKDAGGNIVTRNYKIETASYVDGNLIITKKGFNGGPIRITAWDQYCVYNGAFQGETNKTLSGTSAQPAAKAEGLLPGDYVQSVYITGARQSEPGVYASSLIPSAARIVDAQGAPRDAYYTFATSGYVAGTLTIFKKGNGVAEDPNTGKEYPLQIVANRQDHIYDGTPKGITGAGLTLTLPANANLVSVPGLLTSLHEVRRVTLNGAKQIDPGTYADDLEPMAVVIVAKGDPTGADIANKYYDIDGTAYSNGTSYVRGDLVVHQKGNGTQDPSTGGEKPLTLSAAHQVYEYNGQPQGKVGAQTIAQGEQNPVAAATGLLPGHYLAGVTLDGARETNPTTAPVPLIPKSPIVILDAVGNDRTSKYLIDAQASFPAAGYGSLAITPKGGVVITAVDQTYIYNGTLQGQTGTGLAATGLATATGLSAGHSLSAVSIAGTQVKAPNSTLPATSRPALTASAPLIVETATGADVTASYTNVAYVAGRLTVYPKGNGFPDPNGGEKPLTVTAKAQEYTYTGSVLGLHGANVDPSLTVDVSAGALVAGQQLRLADLAVSQGGAAATPMNAGSYILTPSNLRVSSPVDGDVTACYNIQPTSYVAGPLTIYKKGNGVPVSPGAAEEQPLVITAADQTYAYNGTNQGVVGTGLANDPAAPLATVTALATGHRLKQVDILGAQWAQATGANPRPLTPDNAVIVDGPGSNAADVTTNYNIVRQSYVDGGLHIVGAQGTNVRVAALDQLYVYDGTPKGTLGTALYDASAPGQLVSVSGLFYGDTLTQVTLSGAQRTEPGDDPITPTAVKIMRGSVDVTASYGLTAANFVAGTLTVQKRGGGVDGSGKSIPLTIKAKDQCDTFNGQPQGDIGVKATAADVATVTEALSAGVLLPGDRLSYINISGSQRTYPTEPASVLTPGQAKITDANGNDRSQYYMLDEAKGEVTYQIGLLTIRKRGDGIVDPNTNREGPLPLRAKNQEYTYNGGPQGVAGTLTDPSKIAAAAEAGNLAPGHGIGGVSIAGGPRTDAGTYTLVPSQATIFSGTADVTQYYETIDYRSGMLIIRKIGEGGTPGAVITATDQMYEYDGTVKGVVSAQTDPVAAVATVQGLASTDRLQYVFIGAPAQRVAPGAYALQPQQAAIYNGGTDVTRNYELTAASYQKGTLTITKAGLVNPVAIQAKDQYYVYNKAPQGIVGDIQTNLSAVATATGLPAGHTLERVYLDGARQTLPTATPADITPRDARVYFNGVDVSDRFSFTYLKGALTVDQKGNGPDPVTGVERPLLVTAKDQMYFYNGRPQGMFGTFTTRTADKPDAVADVLGLLPGDKLVSLTLDGTRQTAPGTTALTPLAAIIRDQDGAGADVTGTYKITGATYRDGTLTIQQLGVTFKPLDQHHVYNGAPQGDVIDVLRPNDPTKPLAALASGTLLPGHTLSEVRVAGIQRKEPGTYQSALTLAEVRILDGTTDVTAMYNVSFGADATLFIHLKGNGDPDPNTGGEMPFIVRALDQVYVYDDGSHGYVGQNLNPAAVPISIVDTIQLLPGHTVATVDIDGAQRTEAGTSPLKPHGIKIVDAFGVDVTRYYRIENASYIPGSLIVEQRGPNGTNQPLRVEANDQKYQYNGQPQGEVGQNLTYDPLAPVVTVSGLLPGHFVGTVSIHGAQRTQSGTYTDALMPDNVRIFRKNGTQSVDVTANYRIDASSYVAGDLVILPRGANNPVRVLAADQSYSYTGQPQGRVGLQTLPPGDPDPVATTEQTLDFGDRLAQATIGGQQQTVPGVYTDTLTVTAPIIRDAANTDITSNYRLTDPALFGKGTLTIYPKGSGTPDPNGGEQPLIVRAKDQNFLYDENEHGVVGTLTTSWAIAQYAEVLQLAPGHTVKSVTIGGSRRIAPGEYPLEPRDINIVDQSGQEVQQHYRITQASFVPGVLRVYQKGNGQPDGKGGEQPVRIVALDQSYVYDGTPRGVLGRDLSVDPANPIVSIQELLPGHKLARVSLDGQARTNPGVYPDALVPSNPRIEDQSGRDVTHFYRIEASSFVPGTLTIHKKGSGDGSGPDNEDPLIVRAADQQYSYNGATQGKVGTVLLAADPRHPVATAIGLLPGHKLLSVTIGGRRQSKPGVYRNTLKPTQVQIVDQNGADVTPFYYTAPEGFIPGTLTIFKKGNGDPDGNGGEKPLAIYALEQTYRYSGKLRGKFGQALKIDPSAPLAEAYGLLPGDRLYKVGLYGARRVAVGRYEGAIMPNKAIILDAFGYDVTDCYLLTQESYYAGDLVIEERGPGEVTEDILEINGSPLGFDPKDPFRVYAGITSRDVGDTLE
jgi:hypothetical protein